MQALVRPGDAVVDAGANLGAYVIPLASKAPELALRSSKLKTCIVLYCSIDYSQCIVVYTRLFGFGIQGYCYPFILHPLIENFSTTMLILF